MTSALESSRLPSAGSAQRWRLLVVIASYGQRNLPLLNRVIANYQAMDLEVEIVVLSEAPKDLPAGVRVLVGLPTPNPWSLPFGHKKVFAENLNRFDLFAYSEDDMVIPESSIRAFMRLTPELASDEIAGFLRFETNESAERSLPEVHGSYHWSPQSVRQRNGCTVAQFSNEHAAFFLLTRDQLKRAIASGGFLREPHQGRYDMLVSAATDPYTSCGFHKVICVSHLDDFLIHHLSNRYAQTLGPSREEFAIQVRALIEIGQGSHPAHQLCEVESSAFGGHWAKSYYEKSAEASLALIPRDVRTVLSIGCGSGESEAQLLKRGARVTALPLDSVIGAVAAHRGIEVIDGSLSQGLERLQGRRFQCIFISHLLHLREDPAGLLAECGRLLEPGGALLLTGPNFEHLPVKVRRWLDRDGYGKLRSFRSGGINAFGIAQLRRWLRAAGYEVAGTKWSNAATGGHSVLSGAHSASRKLRMRLTRRLFYNGSSRFTSDTWTVLARRMSPGSNGQAG